MALPTNRISDKVAEEVKALLWAGDVSQIEIAVRFELSQPTVSNILRGYSHPRAKWPDGSRGDMPVERYEYLNGIHGMKRWRRTDKYRKDHQYSPEVQRAATLVEQIELRIAKGEELDDIIDEDGVMIDKRSETP